MTTLNLFSRTIQDSKKELFALMNNPYIENFITKLDPIIYFDDDINFLNRYPGMPINPFALAAYLPSEDVIVIKSVQKNNLSNLFESLLHELTHWSGNSKRINRDIIVIYEKLIWNKMNSYSDRCEEEFIAQHGMYLLSQYFGLDDQEFKDRRDKYFFMINYPVNQDLALEKANLAVNYLINLVEIKKSA